MDNLTVFLLSAGVMYLILASVDRRRVRASPPKRPPPLGDMPSMHVIAISMVVMHKGRPYGVSRDVSNRTYHLYPLNFPFQGEADRGTGKTLGRTDFANTISMTEVDFMMSNYEQGALHYDWYR